MTIPSRLHLTLLFLRLTVFLVMAIWTADKLVRPEHAAAVFKKFYGVAGLGPAAFTAIAAAELALLLAFVAGAWRRITYAAVLLLHAISTLSSYRQYLHPFEGTNLLFFAAWPMLAGCLGLYLLRDHDTLATVARVRS